MSDRDRQAIQPDRYRALKALAVVLALLISVPGIEALSKLFAHSLSSSPATGQIDSRVLLQPDDPYATLDRIEELAASDDQQVPEVFMREVGLLSEAEDIRVDASEGVVGYTVLGSSSSTIERLVQHMESRGWTAVSLGGTDGATFVKSEGAYTWALAMCTQVGDATSVVVRCMYS